MSETIPKPFKFDTPEQAEENIRVRRAARAVDMALWLIENRCADIQAAQSVVAIARHKVLELLPGRDYQFDLIYRPRLRRRIAQRFLSH